MKYIAKFQAYYEIELEFEEDEPIGAEELKKRAESALSETTLENLGEQDWIYLGSEIIREVENIAEDWKSISSIEKGIINAMPIHE